MATGLVMQSEPAIGHGDTPRNRVSDGPPIAIVTGASRGLGRTIAMDLASHGYQVWLVARDAEALAEAAHEITASGGSAIAKVFDIADVKGAPELINGIKRAAGRIDALINCAGVNRRGSLVSVTPEDYDYVMAINVKGLLFLSQAAILAMSRGGAIVNIASVNSFTVLRGVGVYAASKAAVIQVTRALAIDAADRGIRVNAIAPGFIRTEFNAPLWEIDEVREWVLRATPAGRLGTPTDVLGAVRFFLNPENEFVTGACLAIDGGFTAGRLWPLEVG
ncbi:MAG: SDR family NAD(P)-dependent oxidoreductase [Candidatus Dormibacteria bacterium]